MLLAEFAWVRAWEAALKASEMSLAKPSQVADRAATALTAAEASRSHTADPALIFDMALEAASLAVAISAGLKVKLASAI
jgi:hypothetical protein